MLVLVSINQLLNGRVFTPQENLVLKGAAIKEKKILLKGSIFFLLRVASMRIENNFEKH